MTVRTGEILFIKSVKDGIPNRDPLADSDARRIFDEEDGRISLSDVSIKRDVRDYVLAKYPEGNERYYIFCRREKKDDGKLLGRQKLAESILEKTNPDGKLPRQEALLKAAFDVRVFGAVYSVKNENFSQTGPVQFGWAHSLHPVETKYVQGTVVMPSTDAKEGEEGKTQGTIWTTYTLPFAVFAMPGVINAQIAKDTGMNDEDLKLLLEGLWFGTLNRQARGRGIQQPLLLLHIEYSDPFFRIGFLEDYIELEQDSENKQISSISDITLNIEKLISVLQDNRDKIAGINVAMHSGLKLKGELPESCSTLW